MGVKPKKPDFSSLLKKYTLGLGYIQSQSVVAPIKLGLSNCSEKTSMKANTNVNTNVTEFVDIWGQRNIRFVYFPSGRCEYNPTMLLQGFAEYLCSF